MARAKRHYILGHAKTWVSGAADKAAIQQVSEGGSPRKSCLSIVRFGHVVMPELATGNGVSTARCIRPGGRRDIEP
jgi:hypothetical protein